MQTLNTANRVILMRFENNKPKKETIRKTRKGLAMDNSTKYLLIKKDT